MSTWNHRVIKRTYPRETTEDEVLYGIYEVYYNEDGSIYGHTEDPVNVMEYSTDELLDTLERMMRCLGKPVLVHGEIEFVETDL